MVKYSRAKLIACAILVVVMGISLAIALGWSFPFGPARRFHEWLKASSLSNDQEFRAQLSVRGRFARNNLRQLLLALNNYSSRHGVMPYHPDGSDHALFLLRGFVDESCLAATPIQDPKHAPRWDTDHRQVINCGWEYLNEQGAVWNSASRQIVLISNEIPGGKALYLAFKNELILVEYFEHDPGRSLLGAGLMRDGSLKKRGVGSWIWSTSAEEYTFHPEE